jgi:hypothetical protein
MSRNILFEDLSHSCPMLQMCGTRLIAMICLFWGKAEARPSVGNLYGQANPSLHFVMIISRRRSYHPHLSWLSPLSTVDNLSIMDPNDPFIQSCKNFRDYPKCLMGHNALSHTARAYQERLVNRTDDLFNERRAAVDFLDIEHSAPGMCLHTPNNLY